MIYREYKGVSINKWENKYHFKLDDKWFVRNKLKEAKARIDHYHYYEYQYYLMDNPIYSN